MELAHLLRRLGTRRERTVSERSCLLKNNQQEINGEDDQPHSKISYNKDF